LRSNYWFTAYSNQECKFSLPNTRKTNTIWHPHLTKVKVPKLESVLGKIICSVDNASQCNPVVFYSVITYLSWRDHRAPTSWSLYVKFLVYTVRTYVHTNISMLICIRTWNVGGINHKYKQKYIDTYVLHWPIYNMLFMKVHQITSIHRVQPISRKVTIMLRLE
jgi:hypothetical protein